MADSVYGSAFFIITTCHGLHVLIGASFLAVGAFRLSHFSKSHHLGLEAAI
jgi:heme/copper-type cytochrome/quinol oxidase subunit 3